MKVSKCARVDGGSGETWAGGAWARRNLGSRGRSAADMGRGQRGEWFLCSWEKSGNRKNIGEDKSHYDLPNSTN